MTFFSFFFFLRLTYRFRTDDIKLNLKILHRYPFRTRFKRVFRNLERPSSLIISLTKMRNKIKIHRRTNRFVGPWKRDSQSVRTKRNYISKKFLAYRGPFFLLFSPSKDQREARKGESTRSTRTLRNLFVYHALGGIQVRRRVSYSLASRRNISLSSFEASILPS